MGRQAVQGLQFRSHRRGFRRDRTISTVVRAGSLATLGLQLLIVTPLPEGARHQAVREIGGFVDNPAGTFSRLQTMTIEEYRTRQRIAPDVTSRWTTPEGYRCQSASALGQRLTAACARCRRTVRPDQKYHCADPNHRRSVTISPPQATGGNVGPWPPGRPSVFLPWNGRPSEDEVSVATNLTGRWFPRSDKPGLC